MMLKPFVSRMQIHAIFLINNFHSTKCHASFVFLHAICHPASFLFVYSDLSNRRAENELFMFSNF